MDGGKVSFVIRFNVFLFVIAISLSINFYHLIGVPVHEYFALIAIVVLQLVHFSNDKEVAFDGSS